MGLDRRDGRGKSPRDRYTDRAHDAHQLEGPGGVLHPAAAGGEAHGPHRARHSATRCDRRAGDRHRGARTDPPFRQVRRRRFGESEDREGRDLRVPRVERLRQVDDHEDADGTAASERRHGDPLRQLRRGRQHGSAPQPWLHDAGILAVRRADDPREPHAGCAPVSHPSRRGKDPHRRAGRALRIGSASRFAGRLTADGPAPAALARSRGAPRAEAVDPR